MTKRLRVLMMTSLGITPVYSGGPTRVFHLLKELSAHADVTLITSQPERQIRSDVRGPELAAVRILSSTDSPPPLSRTWGEKLTNLFRRLHERTRRRVWRKNPFGMTCMPQYGWFHLIDLAFRDNPPDIVVFEQSWHIETLQHLRKKCPGTPCILSAQNVKTTLFEQALRTAHPSLRTPLTRYRRWFRRIESSLHLFVDALWTCSDHDRLVFERMNERHSLPMTTVGNGVDSAFFSFDARPEKAKLKRVICGGTLCWPPSSEAVRFFYQHIWPLVLRLHPDARFLILGRMAPQWLRDMVKNDVTVELIGEVPDARPYFQNASVSVCPILSGSGTRLKVLEAMSMGNAVVTTALGAEGLAVRNSEHALIADTPEEFADAVSRLLSDPTLFDDLRHRGRQFVEDHYAWSKLLQPGLRQMEGMVRK